MPGATFNRLKNWAPEILTNTDLNAEIDNILNNFNASGMDDYSTNSTQMRLQTDPGTVGSESLATSLAGELERLRFVIKRMIGSSVTYWYENPPTSISDLVDTLGTGLPDNRIVSGKTTTRSSRMNALRANGAAASLQLLGADTDFVYYINGVQYTINSDISITGLGLAAAANNTCLVNDPSAADGQWTKITGQFGTSIPVDNMGSSISALIGSIVALKHGAEYFLAYVKSSTELTVARRGCFFDSTGAAIKSDVYTNNDTITLMRLTWIFANTAGALAVVYTNPTISAEQPTSPNTGDYWFDMVNQTWMTYNSTSWIAANAILIGMSIQDTANCVATMSLDAFKAVSDLMTMGLEMSANGIVQTKNMNSEVSIYGNTCRFGHSRPVWDMSTDLDTGLTEAASTYYYFYMKEDGTTVISNEAPYPRGDLLGFYHPTETWRCIGFIRNNGSSNFENPVHQLQAGATPSQFMGGHLAYNFDPNMVSFLAVSMLTGEPKRLVQYHSNPANVWSNVVAAGVYGDFASIAVPAGVWDLTGFMVIRNNQIVSNAGLFTMLITDAAGDTENGAQDGMNMMEMTMPGVGSDDRLTLVLPSYIVQVEQLTTFYLKAKVSVWAPERSVMGFRITAKRMDTPIGSPA